MSHRTNVGDDPVTSTRRICSTCVGDAPLRAQLAPAMRRGRCHYCGSLRKGLTIAALAAEVEDALRAYCVQGVEVRRFAVESDASWWDQQGESLQDLLSEELEISPEAADDLARHLEARDPAWPPDGDEPFFDGSARFHRRPAASIGSGHYAAAWDEFSDRITHERRFFDAGATERLQNILGTGGSAKALALPVLEIGPERAHTLLFRARVAASEDGARDILASPAAEVGPPPAAKATAGRMNPAGISVFYGALAADTAIAEVRPNVGGLVVVAQFAPTRVLRLLDLTRIGNEFTGSIFAEGYEDRVSRRQFLRGFHALIARPVRQGDEVTGYVPTQAVAEYVANVLEFDGLLYASVQVGALGERDPWDDDVDVVYAPPEADSARELGDHNVALLGPAGRVRAGNAPDHAERQPVCGLGYIAGTATVHRVTAIAYKQEEIYLPASNDLSELPF